MKAPTSEQPVQATDWKPRLVYWGLSILFVLKFGKFLVLEIWDVLGPVARWLWL